MFPGSYFLSKYKSVISFNIVALVCFCFLAGTILSVFWLLKAVVVVHIFFGLRSLIKDYIYDVFLLATVFEFLVFCILCRICFII